MSRMDVPVATQGGQYLKGNKKKKRQLPHEKECTGNLRRQNLDIVLGKGTKKKQGSNSVSGSKDRQTTNPERPDVKHVGKGTEGRLHELRLKEREKAGRQKRTLDPGKR